jgi:SprT protein
MKYNKPAQLRFVISIAEHYWAKAQKIWGNRIGMMPTLEMNARLTSTGGRAWLDRGHCDFSCYLLGQNTEYFKKNTIPHELAHIIAWRLYNDKGHGPDWKNVAFMLYGDNNRCHTMQTKYQAERKS